MSLDSDRPELSHARRQPVVRFAGTVSEFEAFLASWRTPLEEYEIEATIRRHPAGKGLRAPDALALTPPNLCTCAPHEYALGGHRWGCPASAR